MVDVGKLDSILKSRGVEQIFVFHTDHWEPWVGPDNWGQDLDVVSGNLAKVRDFLTESEKHQHSKHQTLFYKIQVGHIGKSEWDRFPDIMSLPNDAIGFRAPQEGMSNPIREVMSEIVESSGHEIQLHVHHERYTEGDYFGYREEFNSFNLQNSRNLDSNRLNLSIRLLLERMEIELGRPLEDWSFVHGVWALNGSDSRVCNNLDEIEILMRNGCIADFTMPAGRPWVNSSILQPFTAVPVYAPKGYDFPESDATPLGITPKIVDRRRFLIWNQEIDYAHSSLDYITQAIADVLKDTQGYLEHWLSYGYMIGKKLFIKTHSHSLNRKYELEENGFYPHQHPDVVKIFLGLEEACTELGVELQYVTVNQVMEELYKSDNNLKGYLQNTNIIESITIDERRFFSLSDEKEIDALGKALLQEIMLSEDLELLGNYYLTRFGRAAFFIPAEKEILQYCLREFPLGDSVFIESGPGLGTTLLLLKKHGYNCMGVEAQSSRHRFSGVMKDLAKKHGVDVRGLTYYRGIFPEFVPRLRKKIKIGISTNVISSHTSLREEEVLDKFTTMDHLLIDLGSFGHSRNTIEKKELENTIISKGMRKEGVIYRAGRTEIIHYSKEL